MADPHRVGHDGVLGRDLFVHPEDESVVMTTGHAEESLSEAIRFALETSWPDDSYRLGCDSTLGLAIGSPAWAEEIRLAFANPAEFCARDAEDGPPSGAPHERPLPP